jgi:hypothetical protein
LAPKIKIYFLLWKLFQRKKIKIEREKDIERKKVREREIKRERERDREIER